MKSGSLTTNQITFSKAEQLEEYKKNINQVYNKATITELEEGFHWYDEALFSCLELSDYLEVPLVKVVGVTAALSPTNKWPKNLEDTENLILGFKGNFDVPVSTYNKNKQKALEILKGNSCEERILKTLKGPKVSAFYDNILGGDSVTVDGHAFNICRNLKVPLTQASVSASNYKLCEQAYRELAEENYLKACQLQAITWVTWRRLP